MVALRRIIRSPKGPQPAPCRNAFRPKPQPCASAGAGLGSWRRRRSGAELLREFLGPASQNADVDGHGREGRADLDAALSEGGVGAENVCRLAAGADAPDR